jgi:hypothetical protein
MRALIVVVIDKYSQRSFEMTSSEDEQPVKALSAHGPDEALRVGIGLRRSEGRLDHQHALASEHLVKSDAELRVTIVYQEASFTERNGEAEVAGLLHDPIAARFGGAAGEVNAPALKLDEKEHVEATEEGALHREEVAGHDAPRLLAQEFAPSRAPASRRRPETGRGEQSPDGARRYLKAEFGELSGNTLVAPARTLWRVAARDRGARWRSMGAPV